MFSPGGKPSQATRMIGPLLRVPFGGYLLYCTRARASASVFTIGQITP